MTNPQTEKTVAMARAENSAGYGSTPPPLESAAATADRPAAATADRLRSEILTTLTPEDSNLVRHARFELERIGELGDAGAYGGMVARSALDLIRVLAMAGHSGGSVAMTLELFERLARFDVLSPLTEHPAEWHEVPDGQPVGAPRLFQSTRKPSVFWREGEATWYDLDGS